MSRRKIPGSLAIFRLFGVDVYLHWSWFIVLAILIQLRAKQFSSGGLEALAYFLTLFGIVLLHEFGHALASKSVGGQADTILLMPLGGVAFIKPPPRPGAVLWGIVAGPLVNVLLIPVTILLIVLLQIPVQIEWAELTGAQRYVISVAAINMMLLCFNLLPIYPLDGGQILQCLLWFLIGRARSLRIAAGIGFATAVIGGIATLLIGSIKPDERIWLLMIAIFLGLQAWKGYRTAGILARIEHLEQTGEWAPYKVGSGR